MWSLTRAQKDLATPLIENDNLYYVVVYYIYIYMCVCVCVCVCVCACVRARVCVSITSDLNEISFRDFRIR